MVRALIALALVLSTPGGLPPKAAVKPAAAKAAGPATGSGADYGPSPNYDSAAERELLELANQARAQAGAPPLQLDPGMTEAARAHAALMAHEQQLSHQVHGEPSLAERLGAISDVHLDRAGENIASDVGVQQAEEHLLQSPQHRDNLLNPAYNIAGFAVIRDGARLYVVQDFGHSLPGYSTDQTENTIATAVNQLRTQARLPALQQFQDSGLQSAACSMAQEDRLTTRATKEYAQHYSVLTYTSAQPQNLPRNINRLIGDRQIRNLAVAACYARTNTYPTGVYWVALLFY